MPLVVCAYKQGSPRLYLTSSGWTPESQVVGDRCGPVAPEVRRFESVEAGKYEAAAAGAPERGIIYTAELWTENLAACRADFLLATL